MSSSSEQKGLARNTHHSKNGKKNEAFRHAMASSSQAMSVTAGCRHCPKAADTASVLKCRHEAVNELPINELSQSRSNALALGADSLEAAGTLNGLQNSPCVNLSQQQRECVART